MKKWFLAGRTDGTSEIVFDEYENVKMISAGGPYWSLTPGADTKEQLIEKSKIPEQPCKICGSYYANHYSHKDLSIEGLCFSCDHWDERAKIQHTKIVVDGTMYSDGGKVDKATTRGFLGFGGADWKIEMFDGRIIETNNLWCSGNIPERFKDRIPDNAKFIK